MIKENTNTIILENNREYENIDELFQDKNISKRLLRKLYKNNNILINNNIIKKNEKINIEDIIVILMEDEEIGISEKDISINIIYEDMDLLVLDKEPFMPVHESRYYQGNTLSNGISYYFRINNIKKKIRIVNRLDMDTSGILLIAKSPYIDQQLSLQFSERKVIKKYLALVEGIILEDGLIDKNILKLDGTKKIIDGSGKEAITKYKVIENYKDKSLLEIEILTGRSHQIRLHMASIDHPIIGDSLYGTHNENINRHALHSHYIKIYHPRLKKYMEFKSELPRDIDSLIL